MEKIKKEDILKTAKIYLWACSDYMGGDNKYSEKFGTKEEFIEELFYLAIWDGCILHLMLLLEFCQVACEECF